MLDMLYQKSIERKDEINDFFTDISKQIDEEIVKKEYVKWDFTKNEQDKNFAALDGSFNKTKFMAGYVYAITSQTIMSKYNEDVQRESQAGEINTISTIFNRRIDKILSMHMNIFELKSCLDSLKKHEDLDYILMDGSLRGTLMNYRPPDSISKEFLGVFPAIYRLIENELKKEEISIEITTEKIRNQIIRYCEEYIKTKNLDVNIGEIEPNVLYYLEGVEQLLCIYYLLKNYNDKIICVSKTSTTNKVFDQFIPDSAVIEYTCSNSGFTHPSDINSNIIMRKIEGKTRTIKYPVKNIELSQQDFTISFTKLEDKSNVLKIEIPRKLKNEEELKCILNDLKSISVEGYPHILKKAHDEVKIGTNFMKRINRNIGLYDKTGRDML